MIIICIYKKLIYLCKVSKAQNLKQTDMKADKITIEIAYQNELVFVSYKNMDVMKAMQKLQKEYKGCLIYSVNTSY
jgi:hypothetical protein